MDSLEQERKDVNVKRGCIGFIVIGIAMFFLAFYVMTYQGWWVIPTVVTAFVLTLIVTAEVGVATLYLYIRRLKKALEENDI